MKITACMWSQRQSSSAFRLINDASNDPDCLSAALLSMYWHNWIHFGLMCSSVCPLRHCSWFPALQHAWIYTFFSTCMLIYCLRRHILSCRNIPLNKPSETQAEEQRMISLSDVSYDCFLFFLIAFVCCQTLFSANNELRSVGAVVEKQHCVRISIH